MTLVAILLGVVLALPVPALADEPVARTFNAPPDRVWAVTQAVLKHLGWDIDTTDRDAGLITTESRRLEGEDYGVYAKGVRHRLLLAMKPAGGNRTTVTIERAVFRRERIVFVDKDEPVPTTDTTVQRGVLDAIAKSL
jgi:hypothetical protein